MDKKNAVSQKQPANTLQGVSLEENTPRTNRENQKKNEAGTWTDEELTYFAWNSGVFISSTWNDTIWNNLVLTPDGALEIVERSDEDTVRINRPEGLSDTEYFWKARGQCPSCRDGTVPTVMPGGWFECHKCKWRNG